jgi:sec-independent protein translocase protein TatA
MSFFGLGTGELITLVVVIAIVFSASKMAQLGNALGKFVYSFRKASRGEESVEGQANRRFERGTEDGQLVEPKPPGTGQPPT